MFHFCIFLLKILLLLFNVALMDFFHYFNLMLVVVFLLDKFFNECPIDLIIRVEGRNQLLDLLFVNRLTNFNSRFIMVLEPHDLLPIIIVDIGKFVSEVLVLSYVVVPVVLQFVCDVIEVLYLPLGFCQLLFYWELFLFVNFGILICLSVGLLWRLFYLCFWMSMKVLQLKCYLSFHFYS